MWKVIVDIAPKIIKGTNGCHKYVFDTYKTKKEALKKKDMINSLGDMGTAYIEK